MQSCCGPTSRWAVWWLMLLAGCSAEAPPAAEPEPRVATPSAVMAEPVTPPGTAYRETKLGAQDAEPFDHLGFSLAVDAGSIAAGAYLSDDAGHESGSVYVFNLQGDQWVQQAKLRADDESAFARFGNAVDISGDTLVAGANLESSHGEKAGAAYVFRRRDTTWRQEAKLQPDDGSAGQHFGQAVGVSGSTLVIGAHGDAQRGRGAGAAYVFQRQNDAWRQEAKLLADDAENFDLFGMAVAIDGDTVVVGAHGEDGGGRYSGAAYVFRRSGGSWRQEAKLTAEDSMELAELGKAVDISGDVIAVGAHGVSGDADKFFGAAYVYRRSAEIWRQEAKLLASDARAADRFGNDIGVDADTIVIGAHFSDDAGIGSGSVYVFEHGAGGWSQAAKLTASDTAQGEEFGHTVAIGGDTLAVCALRSGEGVSAAGTIYVYQPASTEARRGS